MSERAYDVFLSFRGPDTREEFVNDLYHALQRAGISAFLDSQSLWIGEYIPSALELGIRTSRIGIAILSERFAESKWCLRELCIMVDLPDFPIFPVFYKVSPSDLRDGGEMVKGLESREGEGSWNTDFIANCKITLNQVSRIKGHCSCNFEKSDLIQQLVKDVQKKLSLDTPKVVKDVQTSLGKSPLVHLDTPTCFGFEWQMDHLLKSLKVGNLQQKVVKVGIHGMSGIGKTTLASIVCKHILEHNSHQFNVVCIVRDVHQRTEAHGLAKVQQSMLCYLGVSESQVDYVQHGKSLIEKCLRERNILLVLDEIQTFEQLEALGGCSTHFGEGTRLLITTTDRQILNVANVDEQYEVRRIQHEDALRLFTSQAFPNSCSLDQHLQTACNEIVSACEGLPIALQVLGKELMGQRDKSVWASWIEKLRRHKDLHSKLKTCYDSLDEEEREMFQDIACFFAWTEKTTAVIFWKELKYSALASLERLSQKHMISLGSHDQLLMHPCLRDLGKAIARQTPSERTRVFGDSDPEEVLWGFLEKASTRCIWYEPKEEEETLNAECFKPLIQLQLLWLSNVVIEGNFAGIHLRRLIWLRWRRYSSECLPPGMNLSKLAILQVTESRITHLWDDQPQNQQIRPRRLKVLVLSGCPLLESLPNMLNYECLQILDLQNCESLKILPNMAGFKSLVSLNMEGCGVSSLPEDFGELPSLRELNLSRCKNLSKLPFHLGNLSNLKELQIAYNPKLTKLPESIGRLKALENLDAGYCQLDDDGLPVEISELTMLTVMNLEHNRFSRLPVGLKKLNQLQELYLDGCIHLVVLPELPPSLKILNIRHCRCLTGISAVGNLQQLIRVDATMSDTLLDFYGLGSLQGLITLNLMGCKSISTASLESSLGGLSSLESLFMGGPGITSSQLQIWYDSITKAISGRCDLLCPSNKVSPTWRFAEAEGKKGEKKVCMEEQNEVLYCAGYIVCSVVFEDYEGDSNWELRERLRYSIERGEKQSEVIHHGSGHVLELRVVRTEEDSDFEWLQMGSKVTVKASSDYYHWKANFRFLMHESPSCNSVQKTQRNSITIYTP